MIPGFPVIDALRFEGWHEASLGAPRRVTVTMLAVLGPDGKVRYREPFPDEDWYGYIGPRPKIAPVQREMFVAPLVSDLL